MYKEGVFFFLLKQKVNLRSKRFFELSQFHIFSFILKCLLKRLYYWKIFRLKKKLCYENEKFIYY